MDFTHLVAFNVALLAAMITPGPALLMAIQTSLSSGRGAGVAIGCGLALMAALWTLMALLGLEAVFRLFPWAYAAAKIAGALYLIHIAWKMWRGARQPVEASIRLQRRAFRQGFLTNALNPKSVLFAAAVLVVVFPGGLAPAESAIVVLNHLGVEILFYSALAFVMTTPAVSRRYLRARFWLDRGAALVMGALGLRLLVNR